MSDVSETAVVLANIGLDSISSKTAHALIRGPSRYSLAGIIDPTHIGMDAGSAIGWDPVGIPVFGNLDDALRQSQALVTHVVIGCATAGGKIPEPLIDDLAVAATRGLCIVNGLHQQIESIDRLARELKSGDSNVIELRRVREIDELSFWTGTINQVEATTVAVLGTDCAVGKRTTALLLEQELRRRGVKAEFVYTGQTGWLQGSNYGFILDATPNDFVSGELEKSVVACANRCR